MKIISYNINGIRAFDKLNGLQWLKDENADIICLQEIRADKEIVEALIKKYFLDYKIIINSAKKKGYSGTCTLIKNNINLKNIKFGITNLENIIDTNDILSFTNSESISNLQQDYNYTFFNNQNNLDIDFEGRLIACLIDDIIIINCYIPNGTSRLDFKYEYINSITNQLKKLTTINTKIVVCTDFNIAHKEIDVSHPKIVKNKSGFLLEERKCVDNLLNLNFIDAFRHKNTDTIMYSWRSYKSRILASQGIVFGWKYRFDYIFVSKSLLEIKKCYMQDLIYSDHIPIIIYL